jgi:hypothetical protein
MDRMQGTAVGSGMRGSGTTGMESTGKGGMTSSTSGGSFHPSKLMIASFMKPDSVETIPKGRLEHMTLDGTHVARAILEPGWKWSTCMQGTAKTNSCMIAHFLYQVSGTLHVKMDNGEEYDSPPGSIAVIPSGHDAWVVGSEPVVSIDFHSCFECMSKEHTH